MKKAKFATGIIGLLTLGSILTLPACKKSNSGGHVNIIGKWVGLYKYDNTRLRLHTYRFNTDSTVEATITITDSASGSLLGYQYKSNGRFHLNGESLKLYHLAAFRNNQDKAFVSQAELVPFVTDTLELYTIKFNNNKTSFYFYYPPCPPNASCAAQIIFKKQ